MTKDRARVKAAQYLEWAGKAEAKSKQIYSSWSEAHKDFDWTQPILRGHHSQKRHEKIYERRDAMHRTINELDAKAKRFREKAENLIAFANRNKGDAEAKREEQRAKADEQITVGSTVYDWCFGSGVVERVNKKTYSIRFASGSRYARDKSFIKI
jgi:hypothetical protein